MPVRFRIEIEILILTFKAPHAMAPSYQAELLDQYSSAISLRSSAKALFLRSKGVIDLLLLFRWYSSVLHGNYIICCFIKYVT